MAAEASGGIDTVMHESRLFPPSADFAAQARIKSLAEYEALWNQAQADPTSFWADLARDELHWFQPFRDTLVWNRLPNGSWVARRMSPTIVWTGILRLAWVIAPPLSGKASRATSGR